MRTKKKVMKRITLDVFFAVQDLQPDYGLTSEVEEIMNRVGKEVSPLLHQMLIQQLLGFHEDMQIEMAENLEEFVSLHEVHFTGCADVDYVLAQCYGWIAAELGL